MQHKNTHSKTIITDVYVTTYTTVFTQTKTTTNELANQFLSMQKYYFAIQNIAMLTNARQKQKKKNLIQHTEK